jgi:aldehyde:ferredoxin oxidoreductase
VKSQALPAYDPRSVMGIGVTYATSPQGADHTAGYTITANILSVGGTVDPLKPDGQASSQRTCRSPRRCSIASASASSSPSPFSTSPTRSPRSTTCSRRITGDKWDPDALMQLGKETLVFERLFNERAGFTAADDRLPAFFKNVPLPPHNIVFQVTDEDLDSVFDFVPDTAKEMGLA